MVPNDLILNLLFYNMLINLSESHLGLTYETFRMPVSTYPTKGLLHVAFERASTSKCYPYFKDIY